jgi:predicted membrane chloride channel (bestrophin family)
MAVLIETTRAVLNSRMRAKFGLRGIGFMILNLKDNFVNYNVISNLLVSVKSLSNNTFVYLRILITPMGSVKSLSYEPFVYLRFLITPFVSVKSLFYKPFVYL